MKRKGRLEKAKHGRGSKLKVIDPSDLTNVAGGGPGAAIVKAAKDYGTVQLRVRGTIGAATNAVVGPFGQSAPAYAANKVAAHFAPSIVKKQQNNLSNASTAVQAGADAFKLLPKG